MNIKFDKAIYNDKYLGDKYSKYADENYLIEGVPYVNFPFSVIKIPSEYKYISWVLVDHDSNPVVNFSWLHWLVANYEVHNSCVIVPELLCESAAEFTHGINSFYGPLTQIKNEKVYLNYGGPTPPDQDHIYTLEVYAHQDKLALDDGFFYNQLLNELEKVEIKSCRAKLLARY